MEVIQVPANPWNCFNHTPKQSCLQVLSREASRVQVYFAFATQRHGPNLKRASCVQLNINTRYRY
eukprot:5644968-Amphidinium_carterae.2